jgi:hypothetical protein
MIPDRNCQQRRDAVRSNEALRSTAVRGHSISLNQYCRTLRCNLAA